ncbi:hypothetical protein LSH36_1315g00008 [Paralvinella palmiformis]|uniref:Sushi domain-containing protein n=1 Tax=Paralvinella palmiformis TaxID=53620 RepID=A0AAD9IUX2_9ANNE|nr:hypothetical protein LSH36_1315g00008 [Paralvinella palmiformis]
MSRAEADKHCIIQKEGLWDPQLCATRKMVICQRFKAEACRDYAPDIENGYKIIDDLTGTLMYACNYFFQFPSSGDTIKMFNCTCSGVNTTGLENCTVIAFVPVIMILSIYPEAVCPPPFMKNANVTALGGYLLDDVTEFTCFPGYKIKNTNNKSVNTTCLIRNGLGYPVWSRVPPCEAITCAQPAKPNNGSYTSISGYHIGNKATYHCKAGFIVNGSSSKISDVITCTLDADQLSASWSRNPSCEAITCMRPPPLKNGKYTSNTRTDIGSEIFYECDPGYIISGSNPVTYNGSAVCVLWEFMAVWTIQPICTRMSCPPPPPVANGSFSISNYEVGDQVTYICADGFNINNTLNEANATCQLSPDGMSYIWIGVPSKVATQNVTTVTTVTTVNLDITSTEATDEATMTQSGMTVNDDMTSNWDTINDTFTSEWIAINKSITSDWIGVNETATSDWIAVNDTITNDGIAVTHAITRDRITAEQETTKAGINVNSEKLLVETTVNPMMSTDEITLNPEIIENTLPPGPLVRQCDSPHLIQHGHTIYSDTSVGSIVTYHSSVGFTFKEGGTVRTSLCRKDNKWSVYVAEPHENVCPKFKFSHLRGTKVSDSRDRTRTKILIQCKKKSYKLVNGINFMHTQCTASKKWSPEPSDCQVEVCPPLSTPANSTIDTSLALEGTIITVTCQIGYIFPDEVFFKHLLCDSDLRWNDTIPDCQHVHCEPAQYVSHAVVTGNINSTDYHTTLTYRCKNGYRFETGEQELLNRCEEEGHWTYSNLSCELIQCPSLVIEHATFNPKDIYSYGDIVQFSCHEGYIYPNSSNIYNSNSHINNVYYTQCLEMGDWSLNETACQPHKPSPFIPILTEAYSSRTIGFIVISIIMSIGGIILATDIPLVIAHLKGLKHK